ncbi:uncharacterized protein BJ212DRAFT_1480147 [Suillus subaureus]|uniref:Uncharacterized protein n=1 Tax=Suillus subaureus TaxID=48587 RepID=A0A9P7ECX2_9AGAM|nr:uncharacterized protein BJ212DRAFT_1480147 [Suillus subaureus]KAG1817580.1 hypothetical protein BJ212DRAFT_1480147 [Suillus subaureus]
MSYFATTHSGPDPTNTCDKSSDYYFKIDKSPFYVWALIIDPRISYYGLYSDCSDDVTATAYQDAEEQSACSF